MAKKYSSGAHTVHGLILMLSAHIFKRLILYMFGTALYGALFHYDVGHLGMVVFCFCLYFYFPAIIWAYPALLYNITKTFKLAAIKLRRLVSSIILFCPFHLCNKRLHREDCGGSACTLCRTG